MAFLDTKACTRYHFTDSIFLKSIFEEQLEKIPLFYSLCQHVEVVKQRLMGNLHEHDVDGGHHEHQNEFNGRRQLQEHGHADVSHDATEEDVWRDLARQVLLSRGDSKRHIGEQVEHGGAMATQLQQQHNNSSLPWTSDTATGR
jgi:hypothetical protein